MIIFQWNPHFLGAPQRDRHVEDDQDASGDYESGRGEDHQRGADPAAERWLEDAEEVHRVVREAFQGCWCGREEAVDELGQVFLQGLGRWSLWDHPGSQLPRHSWPSACWLQDHCWWNDWAHCWAAPQQVRYCQWLLAGGRGADPQGKRLVWGLEVSNELLIFFWNYKKKFFLSFKKVLIFSHF